SQRDRAQTGPAAAGWRAGPESDPIAQTPWRDRTLGIRNQETVVLRSEGSTESKYGVFTSNTSEEGDAHQRRTEPVPGPRCPARDPRQPARICPREAAQHPQRRAGRSEAAL